MDVRSAIRSVRMDVYVTVEETHGHRLQRGSRSCTHQAGAELATAEAQQCVLRQFLVWHPLGVRFLADKVAWACARMDVDACTRIYT